MVDRIINNSKLIFFLIFLFPIFLFAQDVDDKNESDKLNDTEVKKNYTIETEGKVSVFYQTLSWENVEAILHFEFELEKKEKNGKWVQIDKKNLKQNYIDVSLPHGAYRYRVKLINLLGQVDAVSADRYFDILMAYQPETYSLSPDTVYFDEEYSDSIIISGKYFRKETIFALQKEGGAPIIGEIVEINENGTKAKVKFNISKITPGDYTFVVTDPSGLQDSKHEMVFRFQKPVDFYISAGYAFNGFAANKVFKEYFGINFAALSGILRATILPIKRVYGDLGFNLSGSVMQLKNKGKEYSFSAIFILSSVQAVYRKSLIKRRLNFDAHLGMGAAFMVNTKFVYPEFSSPTMWYWGLSANFGTALQVYVYKKLYIELNLDHIVAIKKSFPKYIVQPSLSLGWEF